MEQGALPKLADPAEAAGDTQVADVKSVEVAGMPTAGVEPVEPGGNMSTEGRRLALQIK